MKYYMFFLVASLWGAGVSHSVNIQADEGLVEVKISSDKILEETRLATLSEQLDSLLLAVKERNDILLDKLLCSDIVVPIHIQRKADLNLLIDSNTAGVINSTIQTYRETVYAYFDQLQLDSHEFQVSDKRVHSVLPEEMEVMIDDFNTAHEISEIGILGIRIANTKREIDIPVWRVDERWCLNPVPIS